MHSDLEISSASGSYVVSVGDGIADQIISRGTDVLIVDAAVRHLLPATGVPVIEVAAHEDSKTLAGVEELVVALRDAGVRRGDHATAVGGGVVQDLATFATSIYMRGISWTYVPTTLMAMADSCIGGKSSINVSGVKNLVGNFHPPTRVAVDPRFLPSLTATAQAAGLAEAVKISFCRGEEAFRGYLERYGTFRTDPSALLLHVLSAKRWFVEMDEHDQRERRLLNFGHTFGHALESSVGHSIPHGVAVAIGMLCAARHPKAASTSSVTDLESHCRHLLAEVDGLGAALEPFDIAAYERAFRSDKKHESQRFHLIVPAPTESVVEIATGSSPKDWSVILQLTEDVIGTLGRLE